jgi:hypothetical protein
MAESLLREMNLKKTGLPKLRATFALL